MKLFLLFACATNAASPDSLATLDTANQNLASTKGNFRNVEIVNSYLKLIFWTKSNIKPSPDSICIIFLGNFLCGNILKINKRWIKMFLMSCNRQDHCWNLFKLQWRWNSCWMCWQWQYLQSWSREKFPRRGHWTSNRLHYRSHMQSKRTSKFQWYRNALSMQTKSITLRPSSSCSRKMILKIIIVFEFKNKN